VDDPFAAHGMGDDDPFFSANGGGGAAPTNQQNMNQNQNQNANDDPFAVWGL